MLCCLIGIDVEDGNRKSLEMTTDLGRQWPTMSMTYTEA